MVQHFIKSIDDLSNDSLTKILSKEKEAAVKVISFHASRIHTAVLSNVFHIQVNYDTDDNQPTQSFVAKFIRKELELLDDMFQVEMNFYTEIAGKFENSFKIPKCTIASKTFILIECIEAITTYSVMQPCPEEWIENILTHLAQMHSQFWNFKNSECLSSSAGIGSSLDGKTKQQQFPIAINDFLQQSSQKEILKQICPQIEDEIQRTHQVLHDATDFWTMIHGDFHIGNMLFQSDSLWLVDWATCGKGNPLRDVVFFLILSCHFWTDSIENNRKHVDKFLKVYYDALSVPDFSFQQCQESYHLCVVNQFAILVCYDKFCQELAQSDLALQEHFKGVNTRCSL